MRAARRRRGACSACPRSLPSRCHPVTSPSYPFAATPAAGLFNHVLFQDSVFYDSISASELAMRCGVDMMNIRCGQR